MALQLSTGLEQYDQVAVTTMLDEAGVPRIQEAAFADLDDATAYAATIDGAVVVKLISPKLVHKSDVGAIRLNVAGEAQTRAALLELQSLARSLGFGVGEWSLLVQAMVQPPVAEVLIGLKRDPTFGHVVVAGPGGRLVEVIAQTAIRRCPVSEQEAREMISETALGRLIGGFRDAPDATGAVADAIVRVSNLITTYREIEELDLNPLVVDDLGGIHVVDARAVRRPHHESRSIEPTRTLPLDLRPLVDARSLLVIGASEKDSSKPGNRVLHYVREHGFAGQLAVVHPTAAFLDDLPVYAAIEDVPVGAFEAVCLAIPAVACSDAVERCGRRGVRAAIVLSSDFAEAGNYELEAELAAAAADAGIALCGPNTVGLISVGSGYHASFSQAQTRTISPGDVAFVTQSGAIGGTLLSWAGDRGIGVSRFISVGNQASLSIAEYLEYLADDPLTRCAAVVLEGVPDGPALLRAVHRMQARKKDIVVLKIGHSEVSSAAVASHTGTLAGNSKVYRALLSSAGAICVESLTKMLDVIGALASLDRGTGRRVAVLSTSGGAGALVADLLDSHGFSLPRFTPEVEERIAAQLPRFASARNPIDVSAVVLSDPSIFGRALLAVMNSQEIDVVIITITTIADPVALSLAQAITAALRDAHKPVIAVWTIAPELAREGQAHLAESGIPVFQEPARAVAALAALADPA